MHKFKALFKLLDDDLRDAEMHIKYAEEIYEDGDKAIGAMFVKEAHSRLEHFDYFHKIFKQEVEKVEDKSKTDTVERCLWKESHKKYQSWDNCLREDGSKIQEKYK